MPVHEYKVLLPECKKEDIHVEFKKDRIAVWVEDEEFPGVSKVCENLQRRYRLPELAGSASPCRHSSSLLFRYR